MTGWIARIASLRVVAPLFVTLAVLLVAGLAAVLNMREQRSEALAAADVRIRFEGAALVRDAERFFHRQPGLVREELAFLMADPAIRAVAIFDHASRCAFAHRPEWVGHAVEELLDDEDQRAVLADRGSRVARVVTRSTAELELLYVAGFRIPPAAGELRSQHQGRIYLRLAPSSPQLLAAMMPTSLPVAIAMLAVVLLAMGYIQMRVVRPLQLLGDASRLLAGGSDPDIDVDLGPLEVRRVAVAMQDMACRVREQIQETVRRREFKRAVLDALHEGVLVADGDGRILLANAAARALLGERCDPERGGNVDRLFAAETLAEISRSGDAVACRALNDSGAPFWAEVQSMLLDSFDGPVQVLVVRDVTEDRRIDAELEAHRNRLEELVDSRTRELKEARCAAERASRAKSGFLAAVSHEIRTPLNGVIGMLELLGHTHLDAEQSGMVRTVQDSAGTLLGLIADMLDFSRIEAGRLDLASEPMSIEGEAGRVVRSLDALARGRRVELRLRIADGLPARVLGDPQRLRQVLGNLVGNGIKFSSGLDHAGRVLLTVRCLGTDEGVARIEIAVRDNGIGMRQEDQARIFAPFEQADADTARRFGGTGLGLAIVRRLTDAMQGGLELHSSPGLGSVFTLRIDLPVLSFEDPGPLLLAGLHCAVMGSAGGEVEGWARRLRRAGAVVERLHDIEALREYARQPREGVPVWIVLCRAGEEAQLDALMDLRSAAGAPPPALLLLDDGPDAPPAAAVAGTRMLATRLLTGDQLLEAVAEASGRTPPPEAAPGEAGVRPASAVGARVMVVDDNATNRLVIERQLAALGHVMRAFEAPQAALPVLQSEDFDLVLTDLQMPNIDGLEFVRRIRAMEARLGRPRIPVVALTANALERERLRCLAAGMDDYLTKPVTLGRLRQTLQRWLAIAADRPPAVVDAEGDGEDALATLRGFLGDDPEVLRDYLQVLSAELEACPAALAAALERDEASRVAVLAHQVKSSARSVGSVDLAHACETLERVAQGGTRQSIRLHVGMVEGEITRTAGRLARALATLQSSAGGVAAAAASPSSVQPGESPTS